MAINSHYAETIEKIVAGNAADPARMERMQSELLALTTRLDRNFDLLMTRLHVDDPHNSLKESQQATTRVLPSSPTTSPQVCSERRQKKNRDGDVEQDEDDRSFHSYNSDKVRGIVKRVTRRRRAHNEEDEHDLVQSMVHLNPNAVKTVSATKESPTCQGRPPIGFLYIPRKGGTWGSRRK